MRSGRRWPAPGERPRPGADEDPSRDVAPPAVRREAAPPAVRRDAAPWTEGDQDEVHRADLPRDGHADGHRSGNAPRRDDAPPAEDHHDRADAPVYDDDRGDAPVYDDDRGDAPVYDEIEESVPASARLRALVAQVSSRVRRSVPLRSALFVLPPLLLPPALGLPLGASLIVTLLLLWLAAAAALLATLMFDGSDQLALRAIDRRLQAIDDAVRTVAPSAAEPNARPASPRPAGDTEDALLAIGSQLDRLNDRLDDLAAPRPAAPRPRRARPDDHRPAEQWSGQPEMGEDVGSAPERGTRQWSDEGWQGRMR
jgi:hypothetical protein